MPFFEPRSAIWNFVAFVVERGDGGVAPRDERIVGEVDVVAFAADGERVVARAEDHALVAAGEQLRQRQPRRALGRAVEVGAFVVGDGHRLGRAGVDAQQLLTDEERGARRDRLRLDDAHEHAVGRALVADDELAVAVDEVGVARREQRILGEQDGAFEAAGDVLGRRQHVGDAVHAFALDEDELGATGACMAPKNIVLAPGLVAPAAGAGCDGAAGAARAAAAATGLPQLPQKRWPGAIASPQKAHTLGAAAARERLGGPRRAATCRRRPSWPMPSDAPHSWQTVALMGDSASHASQTSPIVIV